MKPRNCATTLWCVLMWVGVLLLVAVLAVGAEACQDLKAGDLSTSTTDAVPTSSTGAATTTTTHAAMPETGGGSGASGADPGDASGTDDTLVVYPSLYIGTLYEYTTTTVASYVAYQTFYVDESDNGHTLGMHVGDHLVITLHPNAAEHVVDANFPISAAAVLAYVDGLHWQRDSSDYIVEVNTELRATATGPARVDAWYRYASSSSHETVWQLYVHVVD